MPTLLTTVVLTLSLACALAWGRPPVRPQKDNITVPPSAQHPGDETASVSLPSASEMEANLASTLCSGLWTHSTYESCFLPHLQPGTGSRPGMQPPLFGPGKMPAFNQGRASCQQSPEKQMKIVKSNLAGQLATPLPLYKCQYCAKICKSKGGLTNHEHCCKCRSQSKPVPVVSFPPDCTGPNEELVPDEETVPDEGPLLTLAECSRLVSAYVEHPEWQDFLESGRHATPQTTAVNTGWNGLKLDTVSPADKETHFPALTTAALNILTQLSPFISRLYRQLQTGKDPLADRNDLKAFINKADHSSNELFAGGNHSLVIRWRNGPGYVLKIPRSKHDAIRLAREHDLYLWLRDPDNILLNLTTTPMRAAFSVHGKPMLALRQVDGTARNKLLLMKQHHSLNECLDFALSVISHFSQIYRRFLEKDVLLADRHDDNIGFNEIPLQGRKSMGLDDAIIQVPVMLDLDPYWFGNQESRMIQLHLPTWVPVVVGLLEGVFTPVNSNSQISASRVKVIDQLRQMASPIFSSPATSSVPQETEKADRETALQSCLDHWFRDINPEYSELLAEARSHIEPLLTRLNQWDSASRTVTAWNIRLWEETGEVLRWLNDWKHETEFQLLKDFTEDSIINVSGAQGSSPSRDQQILTLLFMIHGRLGCQKCSRTFATNTDFRKHWQHHQKGVLHHCEICGGGFINVTVHRRIHTGEKPHPCNYCGRSFTQSSHLLKHLRTHTGDKPYKCELCGRTYSRSSNLQNHLRTHSGDKPYKCQLCSRCFSQSTHLQSHLRTHSGAKPYKCVHCCKAFSQSSHLQSHLNIHSGARPFKCEHCGKCFSQSGNLHKHERTHSGDKPHICGICDRGFLDRSNLKIHLRIHSGDKPYKCEFCSKRFSQSKSLKGHLRTHSGDKPYKCEHCGKCFSDSSNLNKHLRTHSGDKPYKCEQCGKCCSESSNLNKHIRTHAVDKS